MGGYGGLVMVLCVLYMLIPTLLAQWLGVEGLIAFMVAPFVITYWIYFYLKRGKT